MGGINHEFSTFFFFGDDQLRGSFVVKGDLVSDVTNTIAKNRNYNDYKVP